MGLKLTYSVGIGVLLVIILIVTTLVIAFNLNAASPISVRTTELRQGYPEVGTEFYPKTIQEARDGYVVAELYQNTLLDVAGSDYNQDGILWSDLWTYDPDEESCRVQVSVAHQDGTNEYVPTSTPPPTHTPMPTDVPLNPELYEVVRETFYTTEDAGIAAVLLPTPRAAWPTSTPRPTYTPYPTPTTSPPVSSVDWDNWNGRTLSIDAAGYITLTMTGKANVTGHLVYRVGVDADSTQPVSYTHLTLPTNREV